METHWRNEHTGYKGMTASPDTKEGDKESIEGNAIFGRGNSKLLQ